METKAWYASRTVWAGIIAVLAGVAGVFGYTISPDDQAQVVELAGGIAAAVGGAGAIWGRIKASKAIQ